MSRAPMDPARKRHSPASVKVMRTLIDDTTGVAMTAHKIARIAGVNVVTARQALVSMVRAGWAEQVQLPGSPLAYAYTATDVGREQYTDEGAKKVRQDDADGVEQ